MYAIVTTAIRLPRSAYSAKLREFPDFAFGDHAAFQHRGQWQDYFRRRIGPTFDGRLILEIGCFDAEYLSTIAAKYPTSGFVGLDWKCKPLYDGARRIAELGVGNVALLRARGQDVAKLFADGELDEIWVFHPDPCDRDVELKNRLIAEPFLMDVHRVLRDSTSVLALKTDHPGYYQWVLGLFGMPEPQAFLGARDEGTNRIMFQGASRAGTPRVRARDLMRGQDLPKPSEAIRRRFEVAMNSANYWADSTALAHTATRCFSGEVTLFESRFVRKRMPIYYFELRKKQPHSSGKFLSGPHLACEAFP